MAIILSVIGYNILNRGEDMAFIPHTQDELKAFNILVGGTYTVEYINKDYYNGEESIEKGEGVAFENEGNIYFTIVDPYGMDKMVMQVKILENESR